MPINENVIASLLQMLRKRDPQFAGTGVLDHAGWAFLHDLLLAVAGVPQFDFE
jgi:hypothetical protein